METRARIKESYLEEVADSMNEILTDEFALCIKTRRAHCSVNKPDFHGKHILFEKQYHQLEEIIDDITERIRNLRIVPSSSVAQRLDLTRLAEYESDDDGTNHIGMLLAGHECILIRLREKIGHYANIQLYKSALGYVTGLLEIHQKMAWLLQAHLE